MTKKLVVFMFCSIVCHSIYFVFVLTTVCVVLQRVDSYYKRNYKDYFEFIEGSLKGKDGKISEAEKGILDWLEANKW